MGRRGTIGVRSQRVVAQKALRVVSYQLRVSSFLVG